MSRPIEDYALIGDTHTAALVSRDGGIDWLCLPRFDSPACFAALLGDDENGRWRIAPRGGARNITRRYRGDSLILETTFETDTGTATLIDFMPMRRDSSRVGLVRIVRGDQGSVDFEMDLTLRFAYGSAVPWVRRADHGITAIAGPDTVEISSPVELRGKDFHTQAEFRVEKGQEVPFVLGWHPSHLKSSSALDPVQSLRACEERWATWVANFSPPPRWREDVLRSLLTLKALTYSPTGGIVAAPTTSLPEMLGGVRNWDYRFCWLRDATLTLYALLTSGFTDEARAWRDWLLRSCAGRASQMQILYGIAGERLLPEFELSWLPGYEASAPVRVGNAAHTQLQLDVFGEMLDTLHTATRSGIEPDPDAWALQRELLGYLESHWEEPDEGMWEVRGPRQHFTHSKIMAWVALDRAIRDAEGCGLEGPLDQWRALRQQIHAEVCQRGYDSERNTFVQTYGGKAVDAALLMIPQVGFLPPNDRRVAGTVKAIEQELLHDGFLRRYNTTADVDGLPPGEGAFLACTFWYADALHMLGRKDEANKVYERLLSVRNDVGLLAEEYDPKQKRLLGNFPQAFSHVALINSAHNLCETHSPAEHRSHRRDTTPRA